ncbi:TetR/AcrR family transcriptional regulator C-terminal domain-containing protein [Streptomyces sp. NPDC051956]|uniref:TetR/AcrR family transcriptional regulator C-terminal domain-containing protein n=1 Tax=Streptomyces sp. NPDC051956 TaxID=3365677 RepID=UPI0037CF6B5A
MPNAASGEPGARRRGRPPRIDQDRIVAAARLVPPESLTMQAVADQLGVHRKALHYHVRDREGLLELLARDTLQTELGRHEASLEGDWQEVLRTFATAVRASIVQTGALYDYVRMPAAGGLGSLARVEQVAQALIDAGFDERTAGLTIGFVAELTYASARDAVLVERHGDHPQLTELRRTLDEAPDDEVVVLRRMLSRPRAGTDEQFEFDLSTFIVGLEQRLAVSPGPAAQHQA